MYGQRFQAFLPYRKSFAPAVPVGVLPLEDGNEKKHVNVTGLLTTHTGIHTNSVSVCGFFIPLFALEPHFFYVWPLFIKAHSTGKPQHPAPETRKDGCMRTHGQTHGQHNPPTKPRPPPNHTVLYYYDGMSRRNPFHHHIM